MLKQRVKACRICGCTLGRGNVSGLCADHYGKDALVHRNYAREVYCRATFECKPFKGVTRKYAHPLAICHFGDRCNQQSDTPILFTGKMRLSIEVEE